MPGLTPEDNKIIDLKLDNLKKDVFKEIDSRSLNNNEMLREIHQEIMGLGKRKGILEKIEDYDCRLDNHELRIKTIEDDTQGKIETKKVIGAIIASVFGTGGIATIIALVILNLPPGA